MTFLLNPFLLAAASMLFLACSSCTRRVTFGASTAHWPEETRPAIRLVTARPARRQRPQLATITASSTNKVCLLLVQCRCNVVKVIYSDNLPYFVCWVAEWNSTVNSPGHGATGPAPASWVGDYDFVVYKWCMLVCWTSWKPSYLLSRLSWMPMLIDQLSSTRWWPETQQMLQCK